MITAIDLGATYATVVCSDGTRERLVHPRPLFVKGQLADSKRALELVSRPGRVIVSIPVRSWFQDRTLFERAIPSPYAAWGGGPDGLYIDVGAGTIDVCRVRRGKSDEGDLICLWTGGDAMDEILFKRLNTATIGAAKKLKEESVLDSEILRPIAAPILDAIDKLTSALDPREAQALRRNVVLSGGGSRIRGMDRMVSARLSEEPEWAAAKGAQKIASERWTELSFA